MAQPPGSRDASLIDHPDLLTRAPCPICGVRAIEMPGNILDGRYPHKHDCPNLQRNHECAIAHERRMRAKRATYRYRALHRELHIDWNNVAFWLTVAFIVAVLVWAALGVPGIEN